jgi:hypothetical protein
MLIYLHKIYHSLSARYHILLLSSDISFVKFYKLKYTTAHYYSRLALCFRLLEQLWSESRDA